MSDGQTFVIKQVLCASIKEANEALKEAKVLGRLAHAGVVKYEDVFLDEALDQQSGGRRLAVCIVMELCEMGSLRDLLNDSKELAQREVSFFSQNRRSALARALSSGERRGIFWLENGYNYGTPDLTPTQFRSAFQFSFEIQQQALKLKL